MTCEILTTERLERVFARTAGAEELAMLRAHLETTCESCEKLLAEVDGTELLAAFAGDVLAETEAAAMFARAKAPRRLFHALRPVLALAASVLLVTAGAMLFSADEFRDKSAAGAPSIALMAFAGKKVDGRPQIDRALSTEDHLRGGEEVLFRYRLDRPAYVYLLIESDRGVELAYSSESAAPRGEHEVAARGRALALDPMGLGRKITVVAAASVDPVPSNSWEKLGGSKEEAIAAACPSCGTARIVLFVEVAQ